MNNDQTKKTEKVLRDNGFKPLQNSEGWSNGKETIKTSDSGGHIKSTTGRDIYSPSELGGYLKKK